MIELNLTATGKEQTRIKEYLENNASEILADKINNGVKIVKDNKTLLNKKDLDGFMIFACEEARNQAEQDSQYACVEDDIVFGWAIHYFEEDSIEGELFNEDGTEYKVETPVTKSINTVVKTATVKTPDKKQSTLFDLLDTNEKQEQSNNIISENKSKKDISKELNTNNSENKIENKDEISTKQIESVVVENQKVDLNTGEVLDATYSSDNEFASMLVCMLDNKIKVQ